MRFSRLPVIAMVFGLAFFGGSAQVAHGANLTVTKTADTTDGVCDSDCSLREAIVASNASFGTSDTISFSGLGTGTHTFTFLSALPTITDAVTIDGTTAVSYAGVPVIVLDGTGLPAGTDGLTITTAGFTGVAALAIVSFPGHGIVLDTGGTSTVLSSYIGMDPDGTTVKGNAGNGIEIVDSSGNTIGPDNLITGNDHGVTINGEASDSNVVESNIIGLDSTALIDKGNTFHGVLIQGGADFNVIGGPGTGNTISGNDGDGVHIRDTVTVDNIVSDNLIGPAGTGGAGPGNGDSGVEIEGATSNTVGPFNTISGNGGAGVEIRSAATLNLVKLNKIGTNAAGDAVLANGGDGVFITSPFNTIGPGNVISGNTGDGVAISAGATGNTITGNSIHDNIGLGIDNASGGNTELTPPTVTAAGSASGSSDCASCTIEVFSDDDDEGETFHGTATTAAGTCPCAWSFPGAVTGPNVTATVTDGSGNTSEFSAKFAGDADGDGILDASDNCPTVTNTSQTNSDADSHGNACDNCPSDDNEDQANADGDAFGDACELAHCINVFSYVSITGVDLDCDGYPDTVQVGTRADEAFLGTDPNNHCAADTTAANDGPLMDGNGIDYWPLDFDDNRVINLGDVLKFNLPFLSTGPNLPYTQRIDLNRDNVINLGDVLQVNLIFLKSCVP